MAKDFSDAFYHSPAWRRTQREVRNRAHGLCERCMDGGIVKAGRIAHHITELTPTNISDASVALGMSNLVYVCDECHAILHHRTTPPTRGGLAFDDDGNLVCVADEKLTRH